ncbi:MAG TPA: EF-P lysine aminoacylase EpmA [Pirellulaceae bacterium]|nr:EF-P lysine aminoacylase EpmA [Pirellulaceae bacterium]
MSDADFRPTAAWPQLVRRAAILKQLRAFFDARGFIEVETPLLSHDTVIDLHLDPLPVTLFADPCQPQLGPTLYLQTSPEFGMKRLLASGAAPAIFQITRAFRGAEQGSQHNPEFTMLEWYRVGDDYLAGMRLLEELASEMFATSHVERLTYREAFRKFVNIDPFTADQAQLASAWQQRTGEEPAANDTFDRELYLDLLLTRFVQPQLGTAGPTILYDYPANQAALAQTRDRDGTAIAERFELYCQGVELANGYHELLDATVLLERNRRINAQRQAAGKPPLPEESRLLDAMRSGLPACSGCALGVDRLVMLLTGATSIHEVIAFPIDRA